MENQIEPRKVQLPLNPDQKIMIVDLKKMVTSRRIRPEDHYEVAAILESNGWTDSRAVEYFGEEDIFSLAQTIWNILEKEVYIATVNQEKKKNWAQYFEMVVRSFFRGTIFALPMAISVFSMLTLRFSLWSYEYLSLDLATAIAIGTIASFMTIGGFTQAIARRGFSYLRQGHYYTARRITFRFVRLGYALCILVMLSFVLFNAFFGIFSWRMIAVIVLYFLFLSTIWLSVTIMYILEREMTFAALITVGIFLVYIFFVILKLNIIVSQIIALIIVSLLGAVIAELYFKKAELQMEKGIAPPLPRFSIVIYTVMPFFAYGFLYFTFLFSDRIISWSTNNIYMPYFIWFRGAYELGLDFALLALILPMGLVEVVVNEFMVNLEANQKNYLARNTTSMNTAYLGLYFKRVIIVAVFSLVSAVFVYFATRLMVGAHVGLIEDDLLADRTVRFVFFWAVLAYAILSVALMNAIILFSFSQPEMVAKTVLIAWIVNIIVGFLLSRWVDYTYAVIGLLVGSLVFSVLSCTRVVKVLKNLDYYLYAQS